MFDGSFWELALCFIIALLVLGPERLPGLARTLGTWVARARAFTRNLTEEWEEEVDAAHWREEARRLREEMEQATRRATEEARADVEDVKDAVKGGADEERPESGHAPADAPQAGQTGAAEVAHGAESEPKPESEYTDFSPTSESRTEADYVTEAATGADDEGAPAGSGNTAPTRRDDERDK